jgi:AcrR family transcriptional regulator
MKHQGRPREFDVDAALDAAIEAFWARGYEGASLTELTAAMGLSRPSVYAAFGNKEGLFRAALQRYADQQAAALLVALDAPTARRAVEAFLRRFVRWATDRSTPPGCLTVQAGAAPDGLPPAIHSALAAVRKSGEAALANRLRRAAEDGELPGDADAAELARYVATLTQGIAVQAAGGATRAQLDRVIDRALVAWPG